jgi:hypothetical protein
MATVSELHELLSEIMETNPNAEVRIAHQPSWPLESSTDSVISVDFEDEDEMGVEVVVYIAAGEQLGYLPGAAAEELGWS